MATLTHPHTVTAPSERLLAGVALAAPILLAVLVALHPTDPVDPMELADRAAMWTWLHVGLLVALPALGAAVWWLLGSLSGPAAALARGLLAPALVFYAAFDSLVGIGTGVLVQGTAALDPAAGEAARPLVESWWAVPPAVSVVSAAAQVTWVAVLAATSIAHARAGSPRSAVVALWVATVTFPFLHFRPVGLVSLAALLAAVVVLRRTR